MQTKHEGLFPSDPLVAHVRVDDDDDDDDDYDNEGAFSDWLLLYSQSGVVYFGLPHFFYLFYPSPLS